jgi:hypothetical protein
MADGTEDLIKALNELKTEVQKIREVVDLLLDMVMEGDLDEASMLDFKREQLGNLDPFSMNN